MHVGSVMVFQPPDEGFDYDGLVSLIGTRIAFIPRFRQRVREVPGRLANPVWVDDEAFDVTYHVRRSALPSPGGDAQLEEFVARIQSRPLDRRRPLWEVYLVEGLADGRFAIVSKSHQALVDGINAVDIAHVIINGEPHDEGTTTDSWRAARGPSDVELITSALFDAVRRQSQIADNVRGGVEDVKTIGGRVFSAVGDVVSTVVRTAARPAPVSPLNTEIGAARRFVMVGTDLADFRTVRKRLARGSYADDVTINDVVLATISGALRAWLLTRGEPVHSATTVRAMVPISVYDTDDSSRLANRVKACFVDLPVGEPSASSAAAPDRLCDASAGGGRPGRRRRVAGRSGRVRLTDVALLGCSPGQRDVPTVLQPGHHQRSWSAATPLCPRRPDDLHLPGDPARSRAGGLDRPDLL